MLRRPRPQLLLLGALLPGVFLVSACSRTPKAHTRPDPTPPPTTAPTAKAPAEAKPQPAVVQRSEFVATGKPTPPCRDCNHADGGSTQPYNGKPQLELDDKTLADAQATVDATCQLLEAGVGILEANVKTPDKATAALNAYQTQHKAEIKHTLHRADEIRGRLRAAGYDQDIPAKIRPAFEKRMGAIQKRLEKMRTVYSQHPSVLEAFGAFFPRKR